MYTIPFLCATSLLGPSAAPPSRQPTKSPTEVRRAAERLPAEPREEFSLRFYHGWTLAEIAPMLGASVPTARWLEAAAELRE